MRFVYGWIATCGLLLGGCSNQAPAPTANVKAASAGTGEVRSPEASTTTSAATLEDVGASAYAGSGPVPIEDGSVSLSPANTKIQFVGTHAVPKPDPKARTGGFGKFTGRAQVDPTSKNLKAVSVDIDTASLWTHEAGLTRHLNSPDFFDTREYPKAKFESTRIEQAARAGEHNITGKLTLLTTTKEITVPANVTIDDAGLTLKSDFKIDRMEYGIGLKQDGVDKEVALSIVIGEKTEPRKSAAAR